MDTVPRQQEHPCTCHRRALATRKQIDPCRVSYLKIGIALEASIGGTGLVRTLLGGPNFAIDGDFFELNFSFGGAIAPSSNFNMRPTTGTGDVSSGIAWEWECPFDMTGFEMWINALVFVGSGSPVLGTFVSKGGSSAAIGPSASGTGLTGQSGALAVAAGQTIGIGVTTNGGNLTAVDFTVRLRLI